MHTRVVVADQSEARFYNVMLDGSSESTRSVPRAPLERFSQFQPVWTRNTVDVDTLGSRGKRQPTQRFDLHFRQLITQRLTYRAGEDRFAGPRTLREAGSDVYRVSHQSRIARGV